MPEISMGILKGVFVKDTPQGEDGELYARCIPYWKLVYCNGKKAYRPLS